MPRNKYRLTVPGMKPITVVSVTGIEEDLETVNLPDRTTASGGQRGPVSFSIGVPAHHSDEIASLEAWYKESQDPVSPTYKKNATLTLISLTSTRKLQFQLRGSFVCGRHIEEQSMANEGEMNVITYPMKADECFPVG